MESFQKDIVSPEENPVLVLYLSLIEIVLSISVPTTQVDLCIKIFYIVVSGNGIFLNTV